MSTDKKFGLLRNLLRGIGLSASAADQVVDFIVDLLAGEGKADAPPDTAPQFPYILREPFLSPAELAFYTVLRAAVGSRAAVLSKVGLRDLFAVALDDKSQFRIYTNKIDRKHVDFLLCDPLTLRPLAGIELDDRSHQREDRQVRDAFVDQVFAAARLPLLHIPVRRTYDPAELAAQLAPLFGGSAPAPVTAPAPVKAPPPIKAIAAPPQPAAPVSAEPRCPKCGSAMILRTAKSGANAGGQFWGCSQYPNCRGMAAYTP